MASQKGLENHEQNFKGGRFYRLALSNRHPHPGAWCTPPPPQHTESLHLHCSWPFFCYSDFQALEHTEQCEGLISSRVFSSPSPLPPTPAERLQLWNYTLLSRTAQSQGARATLRESLPPAR